MMRQNARMVSMALLLLWSLAGCATAPDASRCMEPPPAERWTGAQRSAARLTPPWEVDALAVRLNGPRGSRSAQAVAPGGSGGELAWVSAAVSPLAGAVALLYEVFRATWGKFDMTRCELHPSCSRFALEAAQQAPVWSFALIGARLTRNHNAPQLRRDAAHRRLDRVSDYTTFLRRPAADERARQAGVYRWHEHERATRGRCR